MPKLVDFRANLFSHLLFSNETCHPGGGTGLKHFKLQYFLQATITLLWKRGLRFTQFGVNTASWTEMAGK